MRMTITEALSELNLIKKKIEKKKPEILANLYRYDHTKDPFESIGGQSEFVANELQAINDLRNRYIVIRSAIAKANTETKITIKNVSKTINEWLNWRREQADDEKQFHVQIAAQLKTAIDNQNVRPQILKNDTGEMKIATLTLNADMSKISKEVEYLLEVIENLDGQLSLKNATTMIEI